MEISVLIDRIIYGSIFIVSVLMLVVGYFLMKNKYKDTMNAYADRKYGEQSELSRLNKNFTASLQAEETIERILQEEGWEHIFLRRRVPVARVGHNREVDVLAVGPVILVVEVKHWQGYVWSNGPRWFQRASAERGTLEFEDVQKDNVVKAAAVRRYLENTRLIQLPDPKPAGGEEKGKGTWYTDQSLHEWTGRCIVPVVVFTNRRVKLDPATVKAKKYVFNPETFRIFVREVLKGNIDPDSLNDTAVEEAGRTNYAAKLLRRALPSWVRWWGVLRKEPFFLSGTTQSRVAYALNVLRTWDILYMHDGSMITGDVLGITAPNAHCQYERQHLLDIRLHWNTGVWGLAKTFLLNNAGTVTLALTTAKRLAIKKKEKKPRDRQGNVVFTIRPKRRKFALNDRVEMKPAGGTKSVSYAIADIKQISLSQHLLDLEKDIV
ncbi:hypothetical protein AGDE_03071 [Angomonas deanei]|nr:hypothetical protein AGDE_03071 [Angomonas deanei]|eukprot:EPY40855.1 hypothetical protein AGDE_03071 [Angomonas deanei]